MQLLSRILALCLLLSLLLSACTPSTPVDPAEESSALSSQTTDATGALDSPSANQAATTNPKTTTTGKKAPQSTTAHKPTIEPSLVNPEKPVAILTTTTTKGTTASPTTSTTLKRETVKPDTVQTAAPVVKPTDTGLAGVTFTPLSPDDYYGIRWLKTQKNADALVAAYYRLVAGCADLQSTISLKDSARPINEDELNKVLDCYRFDYPQHFWFAGGGGYSLSDGVVLSFSPSYLMSKTEVTTAQEKWNENATAILNTVTGSTPYERELQLHDALVNHVTYDLDTPYNQSAYSALVLGKSVCAGYARAFQYLMYQVGIPCLFVEGSSRGVAHAWNLVQLDGMWYHVDVTWDDPLSADNTAILSHSYLNLPDSLMLTDHEVSTHHLNGAYYSLPAATATTYNYYRQTGAWVESFSVNDLARRIQAKLTPFGAVVEVFVAGDVDTYLDAICKNDYAALLQAIRQAGVTAPFQCPIQISGREVTLYLLYN